MGTGITDFNGDGRPDVVVSGNNGSWLMEILTQAATGAISGSDSDPAEQNPQDLIWPSSMRTALQMAWAP